MRKRRFGRCIARAQAALATGSLDEAEASLAEARDLAPDAPELAPLEATLNELKAPPPVAADEQPPRKWRILAIAAAAGAVAIGAAVGARYLRDSRVSILPAHSTVVAKPLPAPAPVGTASTPRALRAVDKLQIVHETVTAPQMTPEIVAETPKLPAFPAPPITDPAPVESDPVVVALNRPAPTVSLEPRSMETREAPRLDSIAPPPVIEPTSRAVLNPADPVTVPAASRTASPSSGEEASRTRDESPNIRAILHRYEAAYSSLDANAASAVFPAINRGALARAFEGLTSQRVSLGSCDVTVNGPAANAVCSGSATWEPKVGGGVRTEPRRWSFDLRKSGEAWKIEKAVAR